GFPMTLRVDCDGAALGELVSVAQQVEQCLPDPCLVGLHDSDFWLAVDHQPVVVLGCQSFDGFDGVVDQRSDSELLDMDLHLASLDLRQIENIIDQAEEMPRGAQHPVERRSAITSST